MDEGSVISMLESSGMVKWVWQGNECYAECSSVYLKSARLPSGSFGTFPGETFLQPFSSCICKKLRFVSFLVIFLACWVDTVYWGSRRLFTNYNKPTLINHQFIHPFLQIHMCLPAGTASKQRQWLSRCKEWATHRWIWCWKWPTRHRRGHVCIAKRSPFLLAEQHWLWLSLFCC